MKENIFAGLYNKIVGFFSNVEQKDSADESKNVARNRLKLVLMQDRTNLNPNLLERMRGELIELLSKYVEMDKEALDLNFDNDGDSIALMLSIPVIRAKDEEEIEAALKAEDDAKKEIEEKLKVLEEQEKSDTETEDNIESNNKNEEDDSVEKSEEDDSDDDSDEETDELKDENSDDIDFDINQENKSDDEKIGKKKRKKKNKKELLNIPNLIEVNEVSETEQVDENKNEKTEDSLEEKSCEQSE